MEGDYLGDLVLCPRDMACSQSPSCQAQALPLTQGWDLLLSLSPASWSCWYPEALARPHSSHARDVPLRLDKVRFN